jgi:GDP-D-mannose 3',5'-epimerase
MLNGLRPTQRGAFPALLQGGIIHAYPFVSVRSLIHVAVRAASTAFSCNKETGMSRTTKVLVTGAGGFIGHHLVTYLKSLGYWVRGVDLKYPEYEPSAADEFELTNLRKLKSCLRVMRGMDEVYALAADMGGMGFISKHHARILRNNLLISVNTLEAARQSWIGRLLYSSSACVYPDYRQVSTDVAPLKEDDAYPAQPQDAYGWEKLVTERLCSHFNADYGLETRVVRFHNIYGPLGTWEGGREKAPAALCRKVALAKLTDNAAVEIWGDGEQTRSFCYIDDCVVGIHKLMRSNHREPINLGQDRMVTINQLADMVSRIAKVEITKKHVAGPQGVRGRNSDNSRLREILHWQPTTTLEQGLERTYRWIEEQVRARLQGRDSQRSEQGPIAIAHG